MTKPINDSQLPREPFVRAALQDTNSLKRVLTQLRMTEIEAALEVESASRRRRIILKRLIGRYVELRSRGLRVALQEKYLP